MKRVIPLILAVIIAIMSIPVSAAEMKNKPYSYTFGMYDYVTKEESTETITVDYTMMRANPDLQQRSVTIGNNNYVYTEDYTPGLSQITNSQRSASTISPALPVNSESEALDALTQVNASSNPYQRITLNANGFDFDPNIDGPDYWTYGTGFMEGNDVLLTNFHLMYHTVEDAWATEVKVYTKVSTTQAGLENLSFVHPQTWYWDNRVFDNNGLQNHDWMVMVLQANIGATTGWFGKAYSTQSLNDIEITCSGYPDKQGYRRYQYMSQGYLNSLSTYRVSHTAVSVGGLSGSPLFDSSGIVWAVNNSHANDWSISYGIRITQSLYNLLQEKYLEGRERWGYND